LFSENTPPLETKAGLSGEKQIMRAKKTFRIWHKTSFGIGFEDRRAKSIEALKLSKWIKDRLIEIEEL
jgi:hypothetical protein